MIAKKIQCIVLGMENRIELVEEERSFSLANVALRAVHVLGGVS